MSKSAIEMTVSYMMIRTYSKDKTSLLVLEMWKIESQFVLPVLREKHNSKQN